MLRSFRCYMFLKKKYVLVLRPKPTLASTCPEPVADINILFERFVQMKGPTLFQGEIISKQQKYIDEINLADLLFCCCVVRDGNLADLLFCCCVVRDGNLADLLFCCCVVRDGNLADLARAGSLHEYLLDLHAQYGDITAFWMGQELVVSICSPDLFKQHSAVFDRPGKNFQCYIYITFKK